MNISGIFTAILAAISIVESENIIENEKSIRIIGGNFAGPGEIPYIASILGYDKNTNEKVPFCAGIIISEVNILSSAHCVYICKRLNEAGFECRAGMLHRLL